MSRHIILIVTACNIMTCLHFYFCSKYLNFHLTKGIIFISPFHVIAKFIILEINTDTFLILLVAECVKSKFAVLISLKLLRINDQSKMIMHLK